MMSELNGNEKYYYLPDRLPTDAEHIGHIYAGDIMLYGSECLVLFYEELSATHSYTKLGFVENAEGLAAALGNGNSKVSFVFGG